MGGRISQTAAMIAQMAPILDETSYCFVQVTPTDAPQILGAAIGTFRETEGVSAIVPEQLARALGRDAPSFARITLQVHSDLEGVGLTAAVARALADAEIACNIVAALHHDHVFVPAACARKALATLENLQENSGPL